MGKSYNSTDIPDPCQFTSLCLQDDKNVRDEKMSWLFRMEKNIPIWSRLLHTNCVGHLRDLEFNMDHNYGIEIPNRLWSLWGSDEVHSIIAEAMPISKGYVMINSVLALCASLKYNLNVWSVKLMDTIVTKGLRILKEILQKNCLSDAKFHIDYLIASYIFLDTIFRVDIQSVVSGSLYTCGRYNLARTLMWFFKTYQFGLILCNGRILAIGYAVDVNNSFFVYDCQNKGAPLLKDGRHNSYLLRTNHLQILLYCIIVALNVNHKNIKFTIYAVDITDLEANMGNLDQSNSVDNKSKAFKASKDKLKCLKTPASRKPYIIKRKPVKILKLNNNKNLCNNNNKNNNNNNNNNNGEATQLKEGKENALINIPVIATTTTTTTAENSGPLKAETKTANNEILDIVERISGIRGRRTETTDENKIGLIPMLPQSSPVIAANPYTQKMLKHKFMHGIGNKRQVDEKKRAKFVQARAKLFFNAFGKRSKSQ
uniref:Uncharacterized protein n=1 Tax=Glossina austeni TaxID=7395 RepID=A0A1A9VCG3_GLOAU